MKNAILKIAATTIATGLLSSAASASIIGPSTPTGSEVILSIVDVSTNNSISVDLGKTIDELALGNVFNLGTDAETFIADAGGLGAIQWGVIAGKTQNFTTKEFLTSSVNDLTTKGIANATKGAWENSIIELTGNLNAGDGSGTEVNNTYGPFSDALGSPNYRAGGHDLWQSGDATLTNLASGNETMNLYTYTMSGFGGLAFGEQVLGTVELTDSSLSIVPIPAAVWLFGSALAGLFGAGRREQIGAWIASIRA